MDRRRKTHQQDHQYDRRSITTPLKQQNHANLEEGMSSSSLSKHKSEKDKKILSEVGFEPTPPERLRPERSALDHSAILTLDFKGVANSVPDKVISCSS